MTLATTADRVSANDTIGVGVTKNRTVDNIAARVHTKDESRRDGKIASSIRRSLDK